VAVGTPKELRQFVTYRPDVEAVLQRCGLDTYDLLLIDLQGNWTRWIFPSEDEAETVAHLLGVPLHRGWDDRMSRRMNKRDHWNEPGGQKRAL
jgi:L-rhamnose mutarotase